MRVPPLSPVSVDSSAALSGWEEVWDSRSELVTAELSELSWAWELEGTELSGREDSPWELVFAPPEQARCGSRVLPRFHCAKRSGFGAVGTAQPAWDLSCGRCCETIRFRYGNR